MKVLSLYNECVISHYDFMELVNQVFVILDDRFHGLIVIWSINYASLQWVEPKPEEPQPPSSNHWRIQTSSKQNVLRAPTSVCTQGTLTQLRPHRLSQTRCGSQFRSDQRITLSRSWGKIPMKSSSLKLKTRPMSSTGMLCATSDAFRLAIFSLFDSILMN